MSSAPIDHVPVRDAGAEPPPGGEGAAAWTGWQAIGAYLVAYLAAGLVVGLVYAVGDELTDSGGDARPPLLIAVAGLVQTAMLIGTAAVFAGMTRPPRPRDFGLRAVRLWPAVGWAAVGFLSYVVLTTTYAIVFDPDGEQSVGRALGLERGTAALVAGGFVVVVLAPIGEEVLYRGFVYRGLRNSFARRFGLRPGIAAAALLGGVLFAIVHFTDPKTLPILPVLAILGVVFCLVYERTGSLYPTIALHALVNTLAFVTIAKQDDWIGPAYLAVVVAACVAVPRFVRARGGGPATAA